jgi:hypothetical protein
MGAFYVNYTIKGASQGAVLRALRGRKAFVSAERTGCIFVYDEESDGQDERVIAKLAAQISTKTRSTVFAALIHDSDILWYQLYEAGRLTDRYNSTPDYWSSGSEPLPPEGGNAQRLCAAFNSSEVVEVERILKAPRSAYPDSTDRHSDLLHMLGIPKLAVGYGFNSIKLGNMPEGMPADDLTETS